MSCGNSRDNYQTTCNTLDALSSAGSRGESGGHVAAAAILFNYTLPLDMDFQESSNIVTILFKVRLCLTQKLTKHNPVHYF